jgi:rhodanese-related sulfurtransferase
MQLMEERDAVLVDARPKELYDQKHIQGAINVPMSLFDIMYMMKLSQIDSDSPVVVYGSHVSRRYDEELAFRLKQRDHENVRILEGGLRAWEAEGYPVQ